MVETLQSNLDIKGSEYDTFLSNTVVARHRQFWLVNLVFFLALVMISFLSSLYRIHVYYKHTISLPWNGIFELPIKNDRYYWEQCTYRRILDEDLLFLLICV